jgi:drug/metabolite transporter (DMT)-like permease
MRIPPIPLLLVGVLFTSSSILFIKGSALPPITLSALRQILASLILFPLYYRDLKFSLDPHPHRDLKFSVDPPPRRDSWFSAVLRSLKVSAIPGVFLGLHFITWIAGARMTLGSNAALIVNMSPLVMPFLALAAFRERVTAREAIGTVVSFSGFLLLGIRDLSLDRASFTGDILCFASMLLFSLYLLLARKNETRGKLWLYIVPLYFIGGCFCLLIALAVETPLPPLRWRELPLVLGMALLPTVVGHSIYNASMKRLRSQTVTLLTQGEFLCAALLSFLFFGEVPSRVFYGAAALVIAGICVTIFGGGAAKQPKT